MTLRKVKILIIFSDLDMSITSEIEHHDESEAIYFQQSCEEVVEPINLEYDENILCVEYESFACGFDINESFDKGFCIECESFSFDPIITPLSFESHKSKFVKSENIATKNFASSQTLIHSDSKRLLDFGPTNLPRQLVLDDKAYLLILNTSACLIFGPNNLTS